MGAYIWAGGDSGRLGGALGRFSKKCKKPAQSSQKSTYVHVFIFLNFFIAFLGVSRHGEPRNSEKTFWDFFFGFFGHDPKSHLMTPKKIFLGTCSVRVRPYQGPYTPPKHLGGTQNRLNRPRGAFLRKSKIDAKSTFSAGGGKGALAAWGSHMRLVSTK